MRCYAQNPPLQCQDAWTGTGPGTSQKYPTWTWMKVYKTANSSQVIKFGGKKGASSKLSKFTERYTMDTMNNYNGYKEYSVHMCTRFFWRTHPLQVLCEGLQNVERACCCPYLQLVSTGRTGTLRRQWQQVTGNGPNLNQHTCSPGPGVFKCS